MLEISCFSHEVHNSYNNESLSDVLEALAGSDSVLAKYKQYSYCNNYDNNYFFHKLWHVV